MQSSSLVVIFKFFKDGLSKKLVKGFGSLLCPLASSTSSNTLVEALKKRRGHSTLSLGALMLPHLVLFAS